MKYKVMRFRSKISYIAFTKKMTIQQLLLSAILKCYQKLILKGELPVSLADLYMMQQNHFEKLQQFKC